jgi:6-pyruvoyltetrahydropterin/6-carboxytetrahydropterin synthase
VKENGLYRLGVQREFVAQHYLIGGDWGPIENNLHSHSYQVEVQLEGRSLDQHGYVVDITVVERTLNEIAERYRDKTLNDLPEFAGLNPSVERFSRILCERLAGELSAPNLVSVTVRLWENRIAWVEFRVDIDGR